MDLEMWPANTSVPFSICRTTGYPPCDVVDNSSAIVATLS